MRPDLLDEQAYQHRTEKIGGNRQLLTSVACKKRPVSTVATAEYTYTHTGTSVHLTKQAYTLALETVQERFAGIWTN